MSNEAADAASGDADDLRKQPPPGEATAIEANTAPPPTRRSWRQAWRARVPAPLRHGVTVFIVLLVVEYLVIPRFVAAGSSLHRLTHLNVGWLLAGIVLEAAALFCYPLLMRTLLPEGGPGISVLWRIALAGTAISHVVPGGSVGSATLGYRLLTSNGVSGEDAGVAMATQGMGSAVVLNVLLWLAIVISIPFAGLNTGYVVAALLGMVLLLFIGLLLYLFTRGEDSARRFVRAIGRRTPRLSEDRLEHLVTQIGQSIRRLGSNRDVLKRALLWAVLNWVLDAASLWTFLASLNYFINPVELFVAYGVGNVLAALPITPGGIGVVETSVTALLEGFHVPLGIAVLGVLGWRLVNFWLPIPVGAGCYVSLRMRRGGGISERRRVLAGMAGEATPAKASQGDA